MDQLRFTGLNDDGTQLLLTATDGSRFSVPLTDGLRSAVRTSRQQGDQEPSPITPREVQALMRGGQSAADIAASTDWPIERIQRYEGPILAERAHIATLARASTLRSHERTDPPPTLGGRATSRLETRGVPSTAMEWDATRPEGGRWTVTVRFTAGGRSRNANWHFDVQARGLEAIDDEARWLSEDEQSLPTSGAASNAVFGPPAGDEPDDLMNSMRERRRQRGRNTRGKKDASGANDGAATDGQTDTEAELMAAHAAAFPDSATGVGSSDPSAVPGQDDFPNEALPLEEFDYNPDEAGLPPGARGEDERSKHEATLEDFFRADSDQDAESDQQDEAPDEADPEQAAVAEEAWAEEPTAETEEASPEQDLPDLSDEEAARSKRNRPSVPSWDDIMFGARGRDR